MNIKFDKDIWQFSNLSTLQILEKTKSYRKYYTNLLQPIINIVDFDLPKINEIRIVKFDESLGWFGKVNAVEINNELHFNILFCDVIFLWYNDSKNKRYDYAKGVIAHEFYHCKEMQITSKYIDFHDLYLHGEINTTYKYIFDLAVTQFSEYYTHFYSSKIYSENVDFGKTIFNSDISLTVMKDASKNSETVPMFETQKESIEPFIRNCVIQLARYYSTQDESYLHALDKHKESKYYPNHYRYFINLSNYLIKFFDNYPNNISYTSLIEFGKELLSILNLYELRFSTEDLSDNFEYKQL